jgi:hypothetical protein
LAARGRGRDTRSLDAARSLSRVDACIPLLQAHPTWARDEHEGRGIPTSLTPVSGRLALPPSRSASRSTHLGWGMRRHSLVGLGTPRSRNADNLSNYRGGGLDPLQTNFRAYPEIFANKHSKKLGTLICSAPARTVRPIGADCPDRGPSGPRAKPSVHSKWCSTDIM